MAVVKFRALAKESMEVRLPFELDDAIRERAFRGRKSLSAALTEVVALGLGRDPAQYGLSSLKETNAKRGKRGLPLE